MPDCARESTLEHVAAATGGAVAQNVARLLGAQQALVAFGVVGDVRPARADESLDIDDPPVDFRVGEVERVMREPIRSLECGSEPTDQVLHRGTDEQVPRRSGAAPGTLEPKRYRLRRPRMASAGQVALE